MPLVCSERMYNILNVYDYKYSSNVIFLNECERVFYWDVALYIDRFHSIFKQYHENFVFFRIPNTALPAGYESAPKTAWQIDFVKSVHLSLYYILYARGRCTRLENDEEVTVEWNRLFCAYKINRADDLLQFRNTVVYYYCNLQNNTH